VVLLRGSPRKIVAADLNVVVCKLAELVIVHTEELSLLRGTEMQTGDGVDAVADDRSHRESVESAGENVCDLDVQLLVVLVQKASIDTVVNSVETDNVVGTKETIENETNHACNTVLCENVHGIIDVDHVLDLGCVIAYDSRGDTEEDGGVRWDETRGGSGSDESRNQSRAETNHRPLLSQTEIEQYPGQSRHAGRQVGVPASHDSAEVGSKRGSSVKSQPAKPQENGAEGDQRDIVRTEVEKHLLLTLSKNHRVCKGANSGSDFDRSTA